MNHSPSACRRCANDLATQAAALAFAPPVALLLFSINFVFSRHFCNCANVRFVRKSSATPGGTLAYNATLKAHLPSPPLHAFRFDDLLVCGECGEEAPPAAFLDIPHSLDIACPACGAVLTHPHRS